MDTDERLYIETYIILEVKRASPEDSRTVYTPAQRITCAAVVRLPVPASFSGSSPVEVYPVVSSLSLASVC